VFLANSIAQRCEATAMSDLGDFALGLGFAGRLSRSHGGGCCSGLRGPLAVPHVVWAYIALFAVLCVGASAAVYLQSPDLVRERVRPARVSRTEVSVRALNLLMLRNCCFAGLDVGRLHWSANRTLALQILGLVGFATGMGLTTWAMLVNRFFSRRLRLQPDRGQQVVASGPYRAGAPPRYSGGLLVAAKCRLLARFLDCQSADPAHGAVDGPSHFDRGTHARPCAAPTTCAESGPGSLSGRVVNAA